MFKSNKLMVFGFLGTFAMFSGCGVVKSEDQCGNGTCDMGETATSCSADCMAPPVCTSDGMCDDGETFANCPSDCNNLCTGMSDLAFRESAAGMGTWADGDCVGIAKNEGCMGAGMVGIGVACAAATAEMDCAAVSDCTWGGDTVGCIATSAATCAGIGMNGEAACEMAGCVFTMTGCLPAQSEANCTAGSAALKASKDFECTWNSTVNMCWYPKTGADLASGAASDCGLSCLQNADPVSCTLACMIDPNQLGADSLSTGCMTCYAAVLQCTLDECLLECGEISSACDTMCSEACFTALTGCGTCRTAKGCDDIFDSCAAGT